MLLTTIEVLAADTVYTCGLNACANVLAALDITSAKELLSLLGTIPVIARIFGGSSVLS